MSVKLINRYSGEIKLNGNVMWRCAARTRSDITNGALELIHSIDDGELYQLDVYDNILNRDVTSSLVVAVRDQYYRGSHKSFVAVADLFRGVGVR